MEVKLAATKRENLASTKKTSLQVEKSACPKLVAVLEPRRARTSSKVDRSLSTSSDRHTTMMTKTILLEDRPPPPHMTPVNSP